MFTEQQSQQLKIDFKFWRAIEQTAGRPYPPDDEASFRVLAVRSSQYGSLQGARSAWARAAKELADEGVIKLRKPAPWPVEVTREFRLRVASMNSSDVRIAYQRDPEFRKLWDAMSLEDDGGTIRQVAVENAGGEYADFGAKDWRALPPNTLAVLMTKPSFRKRIDQLIAQGSI